MSDLSASSGIFTDPDELCLSFLIRQAWLNARLAVDEVLGQVDLSLAQYACLLVLECQTEITIADLARAVSSTRQTANELLRGLTDQGLVDRRQHPGDRRSQLVSITAAGRARLEDARPLVSKREEEFEAGFTAEQRGVIRQWLSGLAANQTA